MPTAIGVEETQRMLAEGAQLVDVLPEGEYTELHLPGAQNIPLKKMTADSTALLDQRRPV
ncbi:MAG: rhodanese-like domain-containing protein, partial [Euryarchaeota archaeon]|nr:rhodanese-like domain-containing protein [Euryarchaeota archaeon]